MKRERIQIVSHFMEDFEKECSKEFPELDKEGSQYKWMVIHFRLKFERVLEMLMRKKDIQI